MSYRDNTDSLAADVERLTKELAAARGWQRLTAPVSPWTIADEIAVPIVAGGFPAGVILGGCAVRFGWPAVVAVTFMVVWWAWALRHMSASGVRL